MNYCELVRRAERLERDLAELAALTAEIVDTWDTDYFAVAVDRLTTHATDPSVTFSSKPDMRRLSRKEP